ncbi:MAG: CARDB domain-containing protein [Chitinophagales bacterium]
MRYIIFRSRTLKVAAVLVAFILFLNITGWTYSYSDSSTLAIGNVPVTGVSLDQQALQLVSGGGSATLTATVSPTNATNKEVNWNSSDPSVANVEDGVVTPLTEGQTTVTVTTQDGSFQDTCLVEVLSASENTPDLIVQDLIVPQQAMSGFKTSLQATVKNQGKFDAAKSNFSFVLCTNEEQPITVLGQKSVSKLKPGKTSKIKLKVTVPGNITKADYKIMAVADDTKVISESRELNNTSIAGCYIAPPQIDLVITSVTVPPELFPGDKKAAKIEAIVQNNGTYKAKNIMVNFYLSADNAWSQDDRMLVAKKVSTLNPGKSSKVKVSVKIPADVAVGPYYLIAVADPDNLIPEDNALDNAEGNNQNFASTTLKSSGGESIKVQGITLADDKGNASPSITSPSGTVQLVATIEPANATDKRIEWSLDPSHPQGIVTVDSNGLVTAVGQGMGKVVATAKDGSNVSGSINIWVSYVSDFAISGDNLPEGRANVLYNHQITTTGANGSVTFELQGDLPAGLSISNDGLIYGTPTNTLGETKTFTVKARDSVGYEANRDFTLSILPNVSFTGEISYNDQTIIENNGFKIMVPAGALGEVTENQTLTVDTVTDGKPHYIVKEDIIPFKEIGTYGVTIGSIHEFSQPLTIEFPFDTARVDSDLSLNKAVQISYFDTGFDQWVLVDHAIDLVNNKVTFQTNHLTAWRIEYIIRGYSTLESDHFSILYDTGAPAGIVGSTQYTQVELAAMAGTCLEQAYASYLAAGFKLPTGKTTVILQQALDQSETSTILGNICLSGSNYDDENNLKHECYHELMHVIEREYFGVPYYLDNRWLMEAMADAGAGIHVSQSGQMGGGHGVPRTWFDDSITTADGKHEYKTSFFITYLCGIRSYTRGTNVTPDVYSDDAMNTAAASLCSMIKALDSGSADSITALDDWLKNQTTEIPGCPDLGTAYANYVAFCFFENNSPLVLPGDVSLSDSVAASKTILEAPEAPPDKTITVSVSNVAYRGGMMMQFIEVKPSPLKNDVLGRTLKIEATAALPKGTGVIVSYGGTMDQPDVQRNYAHWVLPDPTSKDKLPFLFLIPGQRLYITVTNLSPDYQNVGVKISDLTEVTLSCNHTVTGPTEEYQCYKHTFDVTASIPETWGITDCYAAFFNWDEVTQSHVCREWANLNGNQATFEWTDWDTDNGGGTNDGYIVLQGYKQDFGTMVLSWIKV